jgi:hypothetical protein
MCAVVLMAPVAALAQVQSSGFSGTWVVQRAEGDLPERAVKALTKGSQEPITLTIAETPTELKVSRRVKDGSVTLVFALGGAEQTQETPYGTMTSRTVRDGSSIVTTGKRPLPGPFPIGTRHVEFTETRSLSADGTGLTIHIEFKTPRGVKTRTVTFRKDPSASAAPNDSPEQGARR